MNKQQLASKIWASANKMRSKIEANEYKDYILGFIFYKFLSDKEENFLRKNDWSTEDLVHLAEEDSESVTFCQNELGYFISHKHLFSTWINKKSDFDVADVRDALSSFDRLISDSHKSVYSNILHTLQTGLSKLGDSSGKQTKAINELLQLIKDIPTDGSQDYDVLGFIYEYLISHFAANAGKKAGEFYTPHEVSVLMSDIIAHQLKHKDKIEIYDPTSGSGSLLINIGQSVAKHIDDKNNIKYYAQELKENTYNLTRMNLIMRDIKPANIMVRNADTLEEDWPYVEGQDDKPLYVDAVVSNPPYSQAWEPENKDADPRYADYGLAPKSKADYAFLLHDLYHVKPDGIMTIVLPHGVLFRGGEEEKIRKNLIERNHLDAVIGLPANIFFGTGIPTIILVLKQKRENSDVLIVDASKGFVKDGKNNRLQSSDIKKIVDTVINRSDVTKYSRKVDKAEIIANDYNLNIPRYVDSSDDAEHWDIYATMFGGIPNNEIATYNRYWDALPSLKNEIFESDHTPYSSLVTDKVKKLIQNNEDVQRYKDHYNSAFGDFEAMMRTALLSNITDIKVSQQKSLLSDDISRRLTNIALVDGYEAYQIFDDQWLQIATDLEIIQTESFEATRKVDPKMVIKKKNGQEEEVQDGWLGRVIPFELVQQTLLKAETDALQSQYEALSAILAEREELLESLSEEEKEMAICNEAKDAFVAKELTAMIKELKGATSNEEKELLAKLKKVDTGIKREKDLKKLIKADEASLTDLTKTIIESLTDEQVLMLLELKWIAPLYQALLVLPDRIFKSFATAIESLANKYATTLVHLEQEIKESEQSLAALIDELEGDEFDMAGLREFQNLLMGSCDE